MDVVGRNGDTIRSITRQSKAKIVVETPERKSEIPVVISLSGTAEAIDTAKVHILLCYSFLKVFPLYEVYAVL